MKLLDRVAELEDFCTNMNEVSSLYLHIVSQELELNEYDVHVAQKLTRMHTNM